MEKDMIDAIAIKKENETEVRCRNCGKLLFKVGENGKILNNDVDKMKPCVIIVSRCTRNGCKTDNVVRLCASK